MGISLIGTFCFPSETHPKIGCPLHTYQVQGTISMAMILTKHLEIREDVYHVGNVFPCIVNSDMSRHQIIS